MFYIESERDLDDHRVFGQQARYIYLSEEDRQRRLPAGRVYTEGETIYGNPIWHGIVYWPGRYDQAPVGKGFNRAQVVYAVARAAQLRREQ